MTKSVKKNKYENIMGIDIQDAIFGIILGLLLIIMWKATMG
jgi:hypothetical protein